MTTDDRTCYFPEGNVASGTYPCTSDDITSCCGTGGICLTNGFCLDVSQPFVVSRGGCTSKAWGDGCPTQCQDVTKSEGASIINLSLINGTSLYCCGTPIYNGTEIVCPYGDSFTMDDGEIILGRAALTNATTVSSSNATNSTSVVSSNSSTTSSSASSVPSSGNSHDVAIGAGVGVPLGLIALGTIAWALWERRRANKLSQSLVAQGSYTGSSMIKSSAPTELESHRPVPELM
ncbi:hypothetical protein N7466_000478 [Penicillium verhagenii]|uniref:uncharacterized protein n=1 Tax=Penicillium verhagenii TaxID=1562060 RepID=UPI00254509BB|nr:uncharacterized protein N7466_000478 [Penicillium verhagenii]KAJ5947463.1 hypothetical protein N7466_000478 [Penicillium verhagenii]